jgi:GNAT superfamily N-acetyltransferase
MEANWTTPLCAALDEADREVTFFLRDDDAGWDDERLFALMDVVAARRLPLDVAVIPAALTRWLAKALRAAHEEWAGSLGLHQHGFAHINHEPNGRKCEFGPSRTRDVQLRDLQSGRELLDEHLPGCLQPVFTPPWNRCTSVTAELLPQIGVRTLSRHLGGAELVRPAVPEMPVSVDWSYARRGGRRLTPLELAELAAEQVRRGGPVGVNLHHAVMDGAELRRLAELCDLLARHPAARCRPLGELVS